MRPTVSDQLRRRGRSFSDQFSNPPHNECAESMLGNHQMSHRSEIVEKKPIEERDSVEVGRDGEEGCAVGFAGLGIIVRNIKDRATEQP